MYKYEAMFIIKPDLVEADRKVVFEQVKEAVTKSGGKVISAEIWAEKRQFTFTIKKCREGLYYLMQFEAPGDAFAKLKAAYRLNEQVLRVLIVRVDEKKVAAAAAAAAAPAKAV